MSQKISKARKQLDVSHNGKDVNMFAPATTKRDFWGGVKSIVQRVNGLVPQKHKHTTCQLYSIVCVVCEFKIGLKRDRTSPGGRMIKAASRFNLPRLQPKELKFKNPTLEVKQCNFARIESNRSISTGTGTALIGSTDLLGQQHHWLRGVSGPRQAYVALLCIG